MTRERKTSPFVNGVGSARADRRAQRQPPIAYGGHVTVVTNTPRRDVLVMWKARWKINLTAEQESRFLTHPEMRRIIGKDKELVHAGIEQHQRLEDIANFVNGRRRR